MVYIVLVNYNRWDNTVECLESILKSSYQDYRIIVVDNGSTNDSIQKFLDWAQKGFEIPCRGNGVIRNIVLPFHGYELDYCVVDLGLGDERQKSLHKINFIFNKYNNGLADAWNTAFRLLKKYNDVDYVWLLGSDTVIPHDSLERLVAYSNEHTGYGILGTMSLYYYDPDRIQCCGFGYGSTWTCLFKHLLESQKFDEKSLSQYQGAFNEIKSNDYYVYGNSIVIRGTTLQKLDFFDTSYFIYFEELELMQQLKKLEIKVGLCPECVVYHKEGASINVQGVVKNPLSEYYFARNRILVTKKHFPYKLPIVYFTSFLIILNRIRKGYFKVALMLFLVLLNPKLKFDDFKNRNGWLKL